MYTGENRDGRTYILSKKLFTEKEIKILSKNPFVKSVSPKAITYTNKFKEVFINQSQAGKFPREIFEECGFDTEILGIERIHSSAKRWRIAFRKEGVLGLRDNRKGNSGRPRERELQVEEMNVRLQAEINLLRAENELLKKIRFAERRLRKGK